MSEKNLEAHWYDIFTYAFDTTYLTDGISPAEIILPENKPDTLTRISSFLGLPNRILDKNKGQSPENLWNNFIGYQDNVSDSRKKINRYLTPLTVTLNTINVPFKLMVNLAKLGTEFLPQAISNAFILGNLALSTYTAKQTGDKKAFLFLSGLFISVLSFPFLMASLIGYRITSPINSVKNAWNTGNALGNKIEASVFSKILGGVLAGLSIAITVTSYAILFPLAIKGIIAPIVNAAAIHAPAFIANAIAAVTPALSSIGQAITPGINFIASTLSYGFFNAAAVTSVLHPALIGLSSLVGLAVTTAGTAISHVTEKFKNWLHKPIAPSAPSSTVHADKDIDTHQVVHANLLKNKQEQTVANVTDIKNDVQQPTQELGIHDDTSVKLSTSNVVLLPRPTIVSENTVEKKTDKPMAEATPVNSERSASNVRTK